MKKLFSTKYSAGAFNFAMLVLRIVTGVLMAHSGYYKLTHFNEILHGPMGFMNFMGLGTSTSLALLVFAEFFCSILIVLGMFTRLAAIPLIISSSVALFQAHNADVFATGQLITLFLTGYIVLLFAGPGKISIDGMIGK